MGVFHRTSVDRRSFWSSLRFHGFFSSSQRLRLKGTPHPWLLHAVHLAASLPAEPTTQESAPQAIDVDDHESLGLLHLRHGMGLQPQLLSQKRFDEHRDPPPFGAYTTPSKNKRSRGSTPPPPHASRCMNDTSTSITLLGEEPLNAALRRNVWNPAPIDRCPMIACRQEDSDSWCGTA